VGRRGSGGRPRGLGEPSPEAEAAAGAYRALREDVAGALHRTAGGRELDALGHREDVHIAAELDGSRAVPVLDGELLVSR
jgi:2-phosphosulfolactate phosphatase